MKDNSIAQTTRAESILQARHGIKHMDHEAPLKRSFIRAVGSSMKSYKLGDLLVVSGAITRKQLKEALALQKETGDQLGKILMQQGALSAVQLYRKLAEQWCIKASTAGVALMMQVMTPSVARADSGTSHQQVRLASAFSPAAVRGMTPQVTHPRLFGSLEVKSDNIAVFTKWTSVMKRFDDQMKTQSHSAVVLAWKAHLEQLKGLTMMEQIDGVNDYINSRHYVEDSVNYHKSDYWATPIEFLTRGGDCEDYAIAKYASLRALGFSADDMRIAIVQDKIKNVPHAILIVYTTRGAFVLDNQDQRTRNEEVVSRYRPIFSINSDNWWLHKAAHSGV
jgi:predicted transglutaminase-like cysteine proteinase